MTRGGWLFSVVLLGFSMPVLAYGAGSAEVNLPADKLAEYVGQYRQTGEPEVVNSISVHDGSLQVEGERMAARELKPESVDHFVVPNTPLRVEFTRDAAGKVTGLKTTASGPRSAGGEVTMERFSAEPAKL